VLGGSPEYLPQGRTQAGDRNLNFHEIRDNLRSGCPWYYVPDVLPVKPDDGLGLS